MPGLGWKSRQSRKDEFVVMGLGLQHIQMVGGVIQLHQYGPRSFLMAAVGWVVISPAEIESWSGMGQLTSPA